MGKSLNLVGQTFHRLTVLRLAPRATWPLDWRGLPARSYIVRCACGTVFPRPLPTVDLRHGRRKSCGCLVGCPYDRRPVPLACKECGGAFRGCIGAFYCSARCKTRAQHRRAKARRPPKPTRPCERCGKTFTPRDRRCKTCSFRCYATLYSRRRRGEAYTLRLAAELEKIGAT